MVIFIMLTEILWLMLLQDIYWIKFPPQHVSMILFHYLYEYLVIEHMCFPTNKKILLSFLAQCNTGIWTILCYGEDMNIIDTVEFVILPSIRTNKVSCNFSVKNDLKLMSIEEEMVLPIIIQKEEKDHRFIKAIKAWIETKYHIEDVCFDKESPGNSHQLCSTKYWSSIGHDPFKSNNL